MRQAYSILWGLFAALVLYLASSAVLGLVSYLGWFELGKLGYDILHYLIVAGACFVAARKAADRGWLVGLLISLCIALFALLMQYSLGRPIMDQLVRSAITVALGTIAGALGVNI